MDVTGCRSPQVTPLTNATQAVKKKTEESKSSKKCCKCCKTPQCCNRITNGISQLCSKLNCCKNSSCCKKSETATKSTPFWRKIFCCCGKKEPGAKKKKPKSKEGCFKRCFKWLFCCGCCKKGKKKRSEESKCCTKCKSCTRGCCNGCKRGLGKCWRAIFCLNRGCCQKIRDKCCCTKAGCCLPGGCCGRALMPGEERHDPKRQSTKSQHARKRDQDVRKIDPTLVDHISVIRAAIPVLPVPLAWFCLFFNIFIPGSGTLWSGLFCLCFGKARFSVKDTNGSRVGAFFVNVLVSISQAFTIIFCLVGWGWSIWWGVMMVRFARKYKRLQQAENTVPTTSQANIIDAEQGAVRH
ncbi:mechanosensory transduction mediator stumble [Lycorma delicatula]|uniref:mechanosensory transduction mediator stumble n=1 Tax=Lycorma delicatula TaxID=130591 RepID=UPI003F50FD8D